MRFKYSYFLLALVILIIDQAIKLWVHYNMEFGMHGAIQVIGDFFKLHYVLNPGFAFGITIDVPYGKLGLTLFRVFAVFGIAYYIYHLIQHKAPKGLIICVAIILGGTMGNVFDCVFYGKFLNNALPSSPFAWFHGQVIDMFFFDFWEGELPNWIPFIGGTYYSTPIFNFADASIFMGVVFILFNNKKYFDENVTEPEEEVINNEETEHNIVLNPNQNNEDIS